MHHPTGVAIPLRLAPLAWHSSSNLCCLHVIIHILLTDQVANHLRTPCGMQLPYIKHGSNIVGDTVFITRYLEATYGNPPPNSALMALTPEQQALCTFCTGFVMERLLYLVLCYRFLSEPDACKLCPQCLRLRFMQATQLFTHKCSAE